jgi:drug/metabolite transporter (DMT)-like permease
LVLVLGAGVLAVSSSAVLIRLAKEAPPLSIAFWRVTLASVLLLPLWYSSSRRREIASLSTDQRWRLLLSGVCLGVHFGAWISSLSYTSVAASVLLVTTNPIWVGLLSPFVAGERLSRSAWLGVGLALLGAGIVGLDQETAGAPNPLLGNGLALLGAVAASGYLLLGRRVRAQLDVWSYASATLAGAWCVLLGMAVLWGAPLWGFGWDVWGLFVAMALLPQMVGHNAMSWSLRYVRADVIAVVLLLEPIGAAFLAWLILSEAPGRGVWWGGGLLLASVAWVSLHAKKSS